MLIRDYTRRDNFVNTAIAIANDQSHGYDQANRWGPDYDCSSLVYTCAYAAGYDLNRNNPRYTGSMVGDFTRCGWTSTVFDGNSGDLEPGDVLLNIMNHTAIYVGNGYIVEASINEWGGITGGQPGDQNSEIHVRKFYNYPWDVVLTPPEDYVEVTEPNSTNRKGTIWDYHGNDNQKFGIIHNDDNTISLVNKMYGLALDVNGDPKEGTFVNFVPYNGSDWQRWFLAKMPNTTNPDHIAPYVLLSKLNPFLVLDIDSNGNGQNGTRLQLWNNLSASNKNQVFYIEDTLEGNWIIRSLAWPNKVIDAGDLL